MLLTFAMGVNTPDAVCLRALPAVAHLLDRDGSLRREGKLDLDRVPVVHAADQWTPATLTTSYRVWLGRLYRREENPVAYGGYQIKSAVLGSRIAREWLNAVRTDAMVWRS